MAGYCCTVYFFILLLSAVLSSRCTSCVSAFHIKRHQLQLISTPSSTRRTRYNNDVSYNSRLLLGNSDIGDADANREVDDGGDLAEQFYNQLNKRQSDTSNDDQSTDTIDDDLYTINSNKKIEPPIRKFTGASTSLFTNQQSTSSSPSSNIQREREREYNLASRFERTFGLQVALLLFSLVFVISIGMMGGITDDSERNFYGEDIVDEIYVDRYRSDDAAEVEERIRQQSCQSSISSGVRVLEKSIPTIDDDKGVDQVAKPTTADGSYWL